MGTATGILFLALTMSSEDIAEEIRTCYPDAEEVIVQYLSGYLVDDAGEEEDVLQVAQEILESLSGGQDAALQKLMARLTTMLESRLKARVKQSSVQKLQKLDKIMDMSKSQLSSTIALSEGVDLESINKGKYASISFSGGGFHTDLDALQSLACGCQETRETGSQTQSACDLSVTGNEMITRYVGQD